jgi:hypothetical protein
VVKTLGFGTRQSQTQIQPPVLTLNPYDLEQVIKPLQTSFSSKKEDPIESYLAQHSVFSQNPYAVITIISAKVSTLDKDSSLFNPSHIPHFPHLPSFSKGSYLPALSMLTKLALQGHSIPLLA